MGDTLIVRPNTDTLVIKTTQTKVVIGGSGSVAGPGSGPAGAQGPTGNTGATGATGPQGATGPAGANGINGANGVGVPTGGTTGQVLQKQSGTNYDTIWVTAGTGSGTVTGGSGGTTGLTLTGTTTLTLGGTLNEGSGGTGLDASGATDGQVLIGNGSGFTLATLTQGTGVTITNGAGMITISATGGGASPLTTKGDIYCFSAADDRLPVGTDGHPVIADSGQATGLNYGDNDVRQAAAPTFAGLTISGATAGFNGVAYTFPGADAAGVLTSDGAGNLSWTAGGGGGMTNPMTTDGDLIIGGTAGAPTRRVIGSQNNVLCVDAGIPTWFAQVTIDAGGTGVDLSATGPGVVYQASLGAALSILANAAGVLTNDGAGGLSWVSGGGLSVTDGTTTVSGVTSIDFTSGATVTDGGGGLAQIAIAGGGGGGLTSPLTTKGDIWAYSTTDARFPVGSDGAIMVADASQTFGFAWVGAATGSGAVIPRIDASWGAIETDTDGATITFDLSKSNKHTVTLGDNRTLDVSNPTTGQVFSIRLVQDGTGGRTVTWWAGIIWPGGSAPSLSTSPGAVDRFVFECTGTGAYDGHIAGLGLS